jgi:hypothetical protein
MLGKSLVPGQAVTYPAAGGRARTVPIAECTAYPPSGTVDDHGSDSTDDMARIMKYHITLTVYDVAGHSSKTHWVYPNSRY